MNSGCYHNDISKVLVSIKVIDTYDCKEKEIKEKKLILSIGVVIYQINLLSPLSNLKEKFVLEKL